METWGPFPRGLTILTILGCICLSFSVIPSGSNLLRAKSPHLCIPRARQGTDPSETLLSEARHGRMPQAWVCSCPTRCPLNFRQSGTLPPSRSLLHTPPVHTGPLAAVDQLHMPPCLPRGHQVGQLPPPNPRQAARVWGRKAGSQESNCPDTPCHNPSRPPGKYSFFQRQESGLFDLRPGSGRPEGWIQSRLHCPLTMSPWQAASPL